VDERDPGALDLAAGRETGQAGQLLTAFSLVAGWGVLVHRVSP